MNKSKVYFTKEIKPESLVKIYEMLGRELKGKVCVKISTDEPSGHNFLDPNLMKNLVNKLNGIICECLTAYVGKRNIVKDHLQTFEDHGIKSNAPCDFLDEDGTIKLPVTGGKHLQGYNIVGSHLKNYDSTLVLSQEHEHWICFS